MRKFLNHLLDLLLMPPLVYLVGTIVGVLLGTLWVKLGRVPFAETISTIVFTLTMVALAVVFSLLSISYARRRRPLSRSAHIPSLHKEAPMAFKSFCDWINPLIHPKALRVARIGNQFTLYLTSPDEQTCAVANGLTRAQAHMWLKGFAKGIELVQSEPVNERVGPVTLRCTLLDGQDVTIELGDEPWRLQRH